MRLFVTTLLVASLAATNIYAADAVAPLAPGQAAGVQKAQGIDNATLWLALTGAAIVAGIAVVSSGHSPTPAVTTQAPGAATQ